MSIHMHPMHLQKQFETGGPVACGARGGDPARGARAIPYLLVSLAET